MAGAPGELAALRLPAARGREVQLRGALWAGVHARDPGVWRVRHLEGSSWEAQEQQARAPLRLGRLGWQSQQ
eukprot:13445031-Alexandrium_andersonii.AAC.1